MNNTERLLAGNKRFLAKADKVALKKHSSGQKPMAAIIACSDSRVIPELIFDMGIGEIFVVRVAGNVAIDRTVIESLEYAVENLGVELLVVLGHTGCGAVAASEKNPASENSLLKEIRASFSICEDHVISNLKRQVNLLPKRSEQLARALKNKKLAIKGAVYKLETGEVQFIE